MRLWFFVIDGRWFSNAYKSLEACRADAEKRVIQEEWAGEWDREITTDTPTFDGEHSLWFETRELKEE